MKKREITFSPPDLREDDIQEVVNTLRSGWITTGNKVKQFERELAEYMNTSRVACLNSATAAMELTLRVLGIGGGDEVITTAYTYTATASVIEHVGATIKLIDTAKDSYEMDYDSLDKAITSNTKAIIAVDIAGKTCDYTKIYEIVNKKANIFNAQNALQGCLNRVAVISDAAHSFGAEKNGIKSGHFADFTCFSFHAVKNLTTGEGGAVTWRQDVGFDDEALYKEYMLYSLHGQSKDAFSKDKSGNWEYDIIYTGYKCNMTDVTASIGINQLRRYENLLDRRFEIIAMYEDAFKDNSITTLNHSGLDFQSSGHLYLTRINNITEQKRNKIISRLSELGVPSNVHYKPLPMLTAYQRLGFHISDYPNAYNLYENAITLPLHTSLTDDDVQFIIKVFIDVINEYTK